MKYFRDSAIICIVGTLGIALGLGVLFVLRYLLYNYNWPVALAALILFFFLSTAGMLWFTDIE